jgi:hypothetical protein
MKNTNTNKIKFVYITFLFILSITIFIIFYAYNSESCKLNKKYICNNNFCLFKEFKIYLPKVVINEINEMLKYKNIQKRVNIKTFPETIFNCALPNKSGVTISTINISK